MTALLLSLLIISAGITAGFSLRRWAKRHHPRLFAAIPRLRKRLQKIALLGFFSLAFLIAIWKVSFADTTLLALPLIGAGIYLLGGTLGFLVARFNGCRPQQTGTLICCGSMTNTGAIGGLVIYIFLGELAFALLVLYKLFEEAIYYGIIFPIAKGYSRHAAGTFKATQHVVGIITDPFIVVSLCAFFGGIVLNLSDIERPAFFDVVSMLCIPTGTFLLLVSIGLGLEIGNLRQHAGLGATISALKYLLLPATAYLVSRLLGLDEIGDGLPMKVVLIASSMPVGFNAIVAASIYDLDLDLANTCWLFSTCLLIIVLPWLF
ncbi:MAG: AEC family transporter, partial [Desulfofustis sp.]|nr:AEC family transporter [Desulfofustis sp.]